MRTDELASTALIDEAQRRLPPAVAASLFGDGAASTEEEANAEISEELCGPGKFGVHPKSDAGWAVVNLESGRVWAEFAECGEAVDAARKLNQ